MIKTNLQGLRQQGKRSPILPLLGVCWYQLLRNTINPRPVVNHNSPSRTAILRNFFAKQIGVQTCLHTVDLAVPLFRFVLAAAQVNMTGASV